jgi:hypothetical protein
MKSVKNQLKIQLKVDHTTILKDSFLLFCILAINYLKSMKTLLLSLCIFFTAYAQEKVYITTSVKDTLLANGMRKETTSGVIKTMVWLDENGTVISKDKFKESISQAYASGFTDTDTAVVAKLYPRNVNATLSAESLKQIRDYLLQTSGTPADSSKIIVINYNPGIDEPNKKHNKSTWSIYEKSYKKELKKFGNINQYWVYKYDQHLDYHHANKITWLHDKDGLIESTFLKAYFSPGSYIIILPNGHCFTYGEYNAETLMLNLKNLVAKSQK